MKNFFKKLSFVMAAAMVITSLHVPAAKAASKDGITIKGNKNKVVTKKSIFVEGSKVNFDYKIGKHMNKGAKGVWSVSDSSVIKVDKNGVVTAVGTGDATLMLTVKKSKKTGIKKNKIYKVMITSYARAKAVEIPASDASVSLKVGEMKEVMPTLVSVKEGVNSTYKLYATSDNATDVAVEVKDNAKVVVTAKNKTASPATITVFAAQKNTAEEAMKNKYKKEATFTVNVMGDFLVEQAGANKLRVKGKDLSTDAALYVVKNANGADVVLRKNLLKVNEAKTEAILEAELPKLISGNYTLTYNKKDEVKFSITEAKVAKIVFPSEKKEAILKSLEGEDNKRAVVLYQVFDQFGDDVTEKSLGSNLNVVSSITAENWSKGKINLYSKDNSLRLGIDRITVTVVDKITGTTASDIFTVANVATVKEVIFKGIYDVNNRKIVNSIAENDEAQNYKLLFTFKDQYGVEKVIEGKNKANTEVSISLLSGTEVTIKEDNTTKFTFEGKDYTAYDIDIPSSARSGNVDLHIVSLNHGVVSKGSFTVTDKSKVDKIIVRAMNGAVYDGQKNELYFEAYDLNGKLVTDLKVLKQLTMEGKKGTELGQNPYFDIDYNDKAKVKLYYDLKTTPLGVNGSDTASLPQLLSFVTETNKLYTASITVKAKRFPKTFLGFTSEVPAGVTKGNEFKVAYDKVKFLDQYGNYMTAKDIKNQSFEAAAGYQLKLEYKDEVGTKAFTTTGDAAINPMAKTINLHDQSVADPSGQPNEDFDKNIIEYKANATVGAASTATLILTFTATVDGSKKEIGKKEYVLHNVDINKMDRFAVDKTDLQPASDLHSDTPSYKLRPSVHGYLDVLKIALGDDDYIVLDGINKNDTDEGQYYVKVPKKADLPAGKLSDTKEFGVRILTTKPQDIKGTYTYSKATPKVSKVEFDQTKVPAVDGAKKHVWNNSSELSLDAAFAVKDQYGRVNAELPNITFTFKEEDLAGAAPNVKVVNNGTLHTEVTVKAATTVTGTIRLDFAKSGYVYEGTITLKP